MKVGDKKQAVILSVVAIGAIAFMGMQLIPKGARFVATAGKPEAPATVEPEPVTLQLAVLSNSFSHPKLAPEKPDTPEVEPLEPDELSRKMTGEIFAPMLPPIQGMAIQRVVADDPEPEENAGSDRKSQQEPLTLKVTGIVDVGEPVAFISVRKKASRPVKVGERIEPGVRLLEIRDNVVTVRIGDERVKLELGEEK